MSDLSDQTTPLEMRKFLTAGQAAAASDVLKDEKYEIEDFYEASASNQVDQRSVLLEKIEAFIDIAVRSGRVLYYAPDRLLVQTLVTNWQGEADQLRRKLRSRLARVSGIGDPICASVPLPFDCSKSPTETPRILKRRSARNTMNRSNAS